MIGQQLAAGMGYIHSKRFVHMDLAARNVLVGDGGQLKVADFGLTHPYDAGAEHYKQLGVLKLSIRWLAVDSFDHKLFGEASDVWSFGITFWEVLSGGTQPYRGMKLPEVLQRVRGGLRLSKPRSCTEDLWAILEVRASLGHSIQGELLARIASVAPYS